MLPRISGQIQKITNYFTIFLQMRFMVHWVQKGFLRKQHLMIQEVPILHQKHHLTIWLEHITTPMVYLWFTRGLPVVGPVPLTLDRTAPQQLKVDVALKPLPGAPVSQSQSALYTP